MNYFKNLFFVLVFITFYGCSKYNTIGVSYYQGDVGHTIKVLDIDGNLIIEKEPNDISGVISWANKVKGVIQIEIDETIDNVQILSPTYNYKKVYVEDGMIIVMDSFYTE